MASDETSSRERNDEFRLRGLKLEPEYRTGSSNPISEFYVPCLSAANIYRRAVGYFRSSILSLVGLEVLDFARQGGRIFLVCSPELSLDDQQAIAEGYEIRESLAARRVEAEVDSLIANAAIDWQVRVLATLIAVGSMEVKVAVRAPAHGLYHEKIGVFSDASGDLVSFIGSANESWSGWHAGGNFESIEVFCGWNEGESSRAERHSRNFNSLWAGTTLDVHTLTFPEAARLKLCRVAAPSLDDARREVAHIVQGPIPESSTRKLLPHQDKAIAGWIAQGCRGIFEHATGSGKTFTALSALEPHMDALLPALILVPSDLLLRQWVREVKAHFPNAALMLAGGGHDRWKESGRLKRLSAESPNSPRIVVATMQTAASLAFRQALSQGAHLALVADEVHQIGSRFNSQAMLIESGPRLGLSATLERYGDVEGTAKILDYFGGVVAPPVTLSDAVAAGRLVEYLYHPHVVHLNVEEADDWKKLTRSIRFEMAKSEEGRLTEQAKLLLIRRSRIAKKCAAKAPLAARIVKQSFEEGQGWLVYCEDSAHLAHTMDELRAIGIKPIEYHSGMQGDRTATLQWFARYGGVLVSIKCLDEGVDIPSVSHAVILASSQNPRQFVQRRGRVLRASGNKIFATVHDAIVAPIGLDEEPEQTSLLKAEFLRAIEFAKHARNQSASAELREMAREAGFDPDTELHNGYEDEVTTGE
ncbi:MAG: Type restriction protein restriction subunit [Rhodocyclales bacterium]|nr:Type restriction protein restriction subunit [Rhodocyclales bacterium]